MLTGPAEYEFSGEFDPAEVRTDDDDSEQSLALLRIVDGVRELQKAYAAVAKLD